MILRGYLGQPPQLAPDPGEIVYARRSEEDRFTLAAVEKAWRNRAGQIRVRVRWLAEDPYASPGERAGNERDGVGASTEPPKYRARRVTPGEIGWITMRQQLGESPLIKQVDKARVPPSPYIKRRPPVTEPEPEASA